MTYRTFFILVFSIYSLLFRGQNAHDFEDTPTMEPAYSHQYTFLDTDDYWFVDTTFSSLKWYRTLNATYKDDYGSVPLHNMGDARNILTLPQIEGLNNFFSLGPFLDYFTSKKEVPFYQVRSPYTEAQYISGLSRGQGFSILHTQNINRRWNFVLRYRRLNTLGVYQNAQNIQSRFLFSTKYHSKNNRYGVHAYALSEKMDAQENGGLENDFEEVQDIPRESVLVNLRGGTPDLRVLRNREFFLQQEYKFLQAKSKSKNDTIDSIGGISQKRQTGFISLIHEMKYQRRSVTYNSNAPNFYDNYFFQKTGYTDSIASHLVETKLLIKGSIGQTSNLNVNGGIRAFHYRYLNSFFEQTSGNLALVGGLNGRIKDFVDVKGDLEYIFSGPLTNNLSLKARGRVNLFYDLYVNGSYHYQIKSPEFFTQQYISNNFIWLNRFANTTTGIVEANLGWNQGYLKWQQFNANDWVYFNQEQLPMQATGALKYFKVEARQNFDFWDFVHLDNRVIFQESISGAAIMPLPQWVTRNALYFDFSIFKDALKCILGTELNYFSSFNSPSYSTGTGRFYVANEKEIGNYPYLDLFAQFKIKRAKVFLRYQHVNEGLNGFRYYAAPAYPLPDRVLRVGISWRFFN